MGARKSTYVVVGASLAGAKAAEALRREGFDGRVVLIGEEPDLPYDRPPLSKGYLFGPEPRPVPYLKDPGYYETNDIEVYTSTRVKAVDPATSTVTAAGGERFGYDRLLLATGSTPQPLRVPGAELEGVRYLRTHSDADRLRADVLAASHVIVVGGGWIGTEIAAAARQLGRTVTLVHRGAMPLERVLGVEVATVYRDLHADQGVRLVAGDVGAVLGSERAAGVRTADGRVVEGDLVVAGVGARPRTELAVAAGLAVDDGIVVDQYLRTSVPGVFAAGDVARAWHPHFGTSLRVEHWANALNQGAVAAVNMLGRRLPYERIPYFYSDQYDVGMEYSGYAPVWDRVVFRGDPAARQFLAFWLAAGRVVAGMNVNVWDVVKPIQALVRSRQPVDEGRLADPAFPIEALEVPEVLQAA